MVKNGNPQATDNQHIVPQFYLRRFSNNPTVSKKKQTIYVYCKHHLEWREEPKLIKNVAAEDRFHNIGEDSSIEDTLANLGKKV